MSGDGEDSGGGGLDIEPQTPLEQSVAGVVTTLTLAVAFGLMAVRFRFFWVAFIVGFAGVLPTAVAITRYYERRSGDRAPARDVARSERERADHGAGTTVSEPTVGGTPGDASSSAGTTGDGTAVGDPTAKSTAAAADPEAALQELRSRYARGELDDVEFERRVERLLETESLSDARTFAERESGRAPADADAASTDVDAQAQTDAGPAVEPARDAPADRDATDAGRDATDDDGDETRERDVERELE